MTAFRILLQLNLVVFIQNVLPIIAVCPQGFNEVSGVCVQQFTSCPHNYVLINGMCFPNTQGSCASNEIYVNEQCCSQSCIQSCQGQALCPCCSVSLGVMPSVTPSTYTPAMPCPLPTPAPCHTQPPVKPCLSQVVAPCPKQPGIPCSNQAVQPCINQPVAPCSNPAVTPCTNQPIVPCTSNQVSTPCTNQPIAPCSNQAVTPCTNQPIAPCGKQAVTPCTNIQTVPCHEQSVTAPLPCQFLNPSPDIALSPPIVIPPLIPSTTTTTTPTITTTTTTIITTTTTTGPPATLTHCPPGTILINGVCRLIYCGKGIYQNNRCIQTVCPLGTMWSGIQCVLPKPIVQSVVFNNTVYTIFNRTEPDVVVNNVNNFVLNNTIEVPVGQASIENTSCAKSCQRADNYNKPIPTEREKCCNVLTPRICKPSLDSGRWNCYSKRYRRCGDFCVAPTIYLRAPKARQRDSNIVVPPDNDFSACRQSNSCPNSINQYDCSGCVSGIPEACSSYCYNSPCTPRRCSFYDQQEYCSRTPSGYGCEKQDGCFDDWCSDGQ